EGIVDESADAVFAVRAAVGQPEVDERVARHVLDERVVVPIATAEADDSAEHDVARKMGKMGESEVSSRCTAPFGRVIERQADLRGIRRILLHPRVAQLDIREKTQYAYRARSQLDIHALSARAADIADDNARTDLHLLLQIPIVIAVGGQVESQTLVERRAF